MSAAGPSGVRRAILLLLMAAAVAGCEKPGPRGLSREQIEQTMKDRGMALKSCWKVNGPRGEQKLRVAVTTTADGQVESAVADGKDAKVNACVEGQIKGWTFPKVEASTKFNLPVNVKR